MPTFLQFYVTNIFKFTVLQKSFLDNRELYMTHLVHGGLYDLQVLLTGLLHSHRDSAR